MEMKMKALEKTVEKLNADLVKNATLQKRQAGQRARQRAISNGWVLRLGNSAQSLRLRGI